MVTDFIKKWIKFGSFDITTIVCKLHHLNPYTLAQPSIVVDAQKTYPDVTTVASA